ncbi:unnamed protein product [Adineta ricciae]|uniref:Uncharacterized protein n=1 Tax=Adineta ricciae TaxID=249248 RepID=A0A815JMX9_ADIRI|nr:unnamed protein product [Adineta ricciae]CAF1521010.1 unnamed protein product [Adineta ricciae]
MASINNTMNLCSYTFIVNRTKLLCRVTGVERTWDYLKKEFNIEAGELTGARYYETVHFGPTCFGVIDNKIYYFLENQWYPYKTAADIVYETINLDD